VLFGPHVAVYLFAYFILAKAAYHSLVVIINDEQAVLKIQNPDTPYKFIDKGNQDLGRIDVF